LLLIELKPQIFLFICDDTKPVRSPAQNTMARYGKLGVKTLGKNTQNRFFDRKKRLMKRFYETPESFV